MTTNNSWNSLDPVQVADGGTGQSSLTAHSILVGNGTSGINMVGPGTNGQVVLGTTSANPTFVTPTAGSGISVTANATTLQYGISTPVAVSLGGTAASSFTAYAPIISGTTSTGAFQSTPSAGVSGQVLMSSGSGIPAFQTFGANGSLILLNTQTAVASATIVFNSTYITTTYKYYLITISGEQPSASSQRLRMAFSTDNGSTYVVSGYLSSSFYNVYNSNTYTADNETTYASLGDQIGSTHYGSWNIWISNLADASGATTWVGNSLNFPSGGNSEGCQITGSIAASSFNAVKFYHNSGNITKGTFSLYGIAS